MVGASLLAPLVLSFLLGTSRGADECYRCANCTGTDESATLSDVFGAIGETNEVDDYIVDEAMGLSRVAAYPACPNDESDMSMVTLADEAKGTKCMTLYFSITNDNVVTNVTSNLMLSCVILAPVSLLFKSYSALNLTSAADYRSKINMLTVDGLVADVESLKDSGDIEDVTAGAVFCGGNTCNELPKNDQVDIGVTLTGYNDEYEDKTSSAYGALKEAGEAVAENMCTSIGDSCAKSGFKGFEKIKGSSSRRQRRSTYNTQINIFLENLPGTTPSEDSLTNIYQSARSSALASASGDLKTLLESFSDSPVIVITEGGADNDNSAPRTSPDIGMFLAILCLMATRLFA